MSNKQFNNQSSFYPGNFELFGESDESERFLVRGT